MSPEQFDLPLPPPGLVFPETPQLYATIVLGIIVTGFTLYTLWQTWRTRTGYRSSWTAPIVSRTSISRFRS